MKRAPAMVNRRGGWLWMTLVVEIFPTMQLDSLFPSWETQCISETSDCKSQFFITAFVFFPIACFFNEFEGILPGSLTSSANVSYLYAITFAAHAKQRNFPLMRL